MSTSTAVERPSHGACESRFAAVREEFERGLAERGTAGASVCVTVDGETVVDLWGGVSDVRTGAAWGPETVGPIGTAAHAAIALCAHVLVDRGELDLGAPVARCWPEFAAGGKDRVTVRQLLSHQAGLPTLPEHAERGTWERVTAGLAAAAPRWEPGECHGDHARTFAFLAGELVRRASGRSAAAFFADEVAAPLDLDFRIVLPGTGAEDPSDRTLDAGGFTNARGLAGMYRALAVGGTWNGVRLVGSHALVAMAAPSSTAHLPDAVAGVPTSFTAGFMRSVDNGHRPPAERDSLLLSDTAFGHTGTGGHLGFADPRARLSFGYTTGNMGHSRVVDELGQALVDAVYTALGHHRPEGGVWVR